MFGGENMDWLLDTYLFREVLTSTQIKMIIFVWNILKCTVLLVVSVKAIRFAFDKIFGRILSKIESLERKQQLITLETIILHAIEAKDGI